MKEILSIALYYATGIRTKSLRAKLNERKLARLMEISQMQRDLDREHRERFGWTAKDVHYTC